MNDVQTHFVAVCPHCSTGLRVRRAYIGQLVVCKQCNMSFRAEEADQPSNVGSGEVGAGSPIQPWPQERTMAAPCPSCQPSLRARRSYIGHHVTCKQCNHIFVVSPPAESGPGPAAPPAPEISDTGVYDLLTSVPNPDSGRDPPVA